MNASAYLQFQFHYGTIKRVRLQMVLTSWIYFNSTMVRLKASQPADIAGKGVFQFHYGTIKSANKGDKIFDSHLFQFHYGTIKRF